MPRALGINDCLIVTRAALVMASSATTILQLNFIVSKCSEIDVLSRLLSNGRGRLSVSSLVDSRSSACRKHRKSWGNRDAISNFLISLFVLEKIEGQGGMDKVGADGPHTCLWFPPLRGNIEWDLRPSWQRERGSPHACNGNGFPVGDLLSRKPRCDVCTKMG